MFNAPDRETTTAWKDLDARAARRNDTRGIDVNGALDFEQMKVTGEITRHLEIALPSWFGQKAG